jgi:hypothetical protein
VRKVKEGETANDIFAFLTVNPNAEVGAVHPKAMPVILRTAEHMDTWLTAPTAEALKLQRPLPDGALPILAGGQKQTLPPPSGARRPQPAIWPMQFGLQLVVGVQGLADDEGDPGRPADAQFAARSTRARR